MSTRAEVVEEGAKVSPIIMWLMYLCNKPETSGLKNIFLNTAQVIRLLFIT